MADKMFENNQVTIIGEIVSDFVFSHEVYGEGFYMVEVSVNRLSNFVDYIPVMVSERCKIRLQWSVCVCDRTVPIL